MARDPLRTAGTLLFAAGVQYILLQTLAEALYPGYSVSSNTISDLGATCRNGVCIIYQPSSTIFDSTVFILGALSFVGAFYIYICRFRLLGGFIALSAWGAMGVGIFPETTGALHEIVSLIAFLFGGLAAIASYRMVRPPMSYFGVVLGAITLVVLVLYATGAYLGLGQGGMERLISYPVLVYVVGFGAHLMARRIEALPPIASA